MLVPQNQADKIKAPWPAALWAPAQQQEGCVEDGLGYMAHRSHDQLLQQVKRIHSQLENIVNNGATQQLYAHELQHDVRDLAHGVGMVAAELGYDTPTSPPKRVPLAGIKK